MDSELWQMDNELEIKVSNMMANRIICMDNTGENYKKFYNIIFAANKRENIIEDGLFTAANWDPMISGFMGPVSLTPVIKNDVQIR
ncbi:hypothetical protein [Draconibacterium mangrovi]|uniref:hypothetical protein n=1 Tax=Draconibacterium mangrovi TaxID=2697469 RepID=UPI0013D38F15|nr:hypothetical protein [Draconibacterium mangrovi]